MHFIYCNTWISVLCLSYNIFVNYLEPNDKIRASSFYLYKLHWETIVSSFSSYSIHKNKIIINSLKQSANNLPLEPLYKMIFGVIVILCLICNIAEGQMNDLFTDIPLSPQFYPTSGVSVAANFGNEVHLFYRGPKYQLLFAKMNNQGEITSTQDLGGVLLSAPAATSTSTGYLVSYVSQDQRVVFRTSISSVWSQEKFGKIRSVNAPAVVVDFSTADEIKIYVTAVNSQLNELTIKNNELVGSPKRIPGVYANGSPAVVNTFTSSGPDVYYKNIFNDVFQLGKGRLSIVPKLSSGFCVGQLGEGGLLILGRGFYRNLEPIFFFDFGNDRSRWSRAPWISDAPSCLAGDNSCTIIVVTSGPKMRFSQYCN